MAWLFPRVGARLYISWQTSALTPALAFRATLADVALQDDDPSEAVSMTCAFAEDPEYIVTLATDEIRAVHARAHALRIEHHDGYINLSTR